MIYIFLAICVIFVSTMVIMRRPLTSAKFTFTIFASFLSLWNINESLSLLLSDEGKYFSQSKDILEILTFFFLALFSLNFPFYRRRDTVPSYYISLLLGIGLTLIFFTIYQNFSKSQPIEKEAKSILTNAYLCASFLFVIAISFFKINKSFQRLKSFFIHILILFVSILVFINLFDSFFPGYFFDKHNSGLKVSVVNVFFFSTVFYFLVYFKFWEFYPGIFSVFYSREFSTKIMERIASATPEGAKFLKDELWKANLDEGWNNFIDNFWFNIIIDETLDNAVEHGGRRIMDDITVQVYQTKSFLDFYIVDRGKGFDPTSVPNPAREDRKSIPSGRGIHIMKKLFNVRWNFLGNGIRVRIKKDDKIELD
ncbi:MAG: ATP-binding protein [Leptospiraceae bacterium]|nr:ATP-binding protein [Leptospiraceae bacterium]